MERLLKPIREAMPRLFPCKGSPGAGGALSEVEGFSPCCYGAGRAGHGGVMLRLWPEEELFYQILTRPAG